MRTLTLAMILILLLPGLCLAQLVNTESIFQNKGDHYEEFIPYRSFDKAGMDQEMEKIQAQLKILNGLLKMREAERAYLYGVINHIATQMKAIDPLTRKPKPAGAVIQDLIEERQARLTRLQSFAPLPETP